MGNLDESMKALTALDEAIKSLVKLGLDSNTISRAAKASADVLERINLDSDKCMHKQCNAKTTQAWTQKFGKYERISVDVHFCDSHAKEFKESLREGK